MQEVEEMPHQEGLYCTYAIFHFIIRNVFSSLHEKTREHLYLKKHTRQKHLVIPLKK